MEKNQERLNCDRFTQWDGRYVVTKKMKVDHYTGFGQVSRKAPACAEVRGLHCQAQCGETVREATTDAKSPEEPN